MAEERLRAAYALAADKSEAINLLALVLAFQQKFIEANDLVDAGLSEYPESRDLRINQARIMAYESRYGDATARLDDLLIDYPLDVEARNLAARVDYYQGRYFDSREKYLAVLDRAPDNLEALIGLYDLEIALRNNSVAESYLKLAQSKVSESISYRVWALILMYEPGLISSFFTSQEFSYPVMRSERRYHESASP